MKKIVLLMAAAALAFFASCSNNSDNGGIGGLGWGGGKRISVRNYSKYKAIGAASKFGRSGNIAAGISANSSGNDTEGVDEHLVGQDSNGNVEDLSLEENGQDKAMNERPLQFYKAFKRFVFFMYWPVGSNIHPNYGKMLAAPSCFSFRIYETAEKYIENYEPMMVMDKSNGMIYEVDNSADTDDAWYKWRQLSEPDSFSEAVEYGDRFYIQYTNHQTNKLNYYALRFVENQLQESYIVKNAVENSYQDIYVDRFGSLFTKGTNENVKYYMALDGSKKKINCADNLHAYSSNERLTSVFYYPDGTFSIGYASYPNHVYDIDAMRPKLYSPLFMGANGYVYLACDDASSREKIYKRYNANGQLESCDWVPEESQEYDFNTDEFLIAIGNAKYYYVPVDGDAFNSVNIVNANKTCAVLDSNGQAVKVQKYDFDTGSLASEYIPVGLTFSRFDVSSPKKRGALYKVQYSDGDKDKHTVSEIPLQGFTPSSLSSYQYKSNKDFFAATKKHFFIVNDGDLVVFNLEDGTKDSACSKSDMVYQTVYYDEDSDKICYFGQSLSSNANITGTIDDNGNKTETSTIYEIKYLSPVNMPEESEDLTESTGSTAN